MGCSGLSDLSVNVLEASPDVVVSSVTVILLPSVLGPASGAKESCSSKLLWT